jgi:hypothetical protein
MNLNLSNKKEKQPRKGMKAQRSQPAREDFGCHITKDATHVRAQKTAWKRALLAQC